MGILSFTHTIVLPVINMAMWPIKWADPGVKNKRKRTDEDESQTDKKVTRKFNNSWMKTRDWLKHENDKMYCTLCINYVNSKKNRSNYPSSFLTGYSNFKSTALQDHESSTLHKDAVSHENQMKL